MSFAAFKNHLMFFAGRVIKRKLSKELVQLFELTKGGIHSTPEKPIPASLDTRMVRWRPRENEAHAGVKTSTK